MWRRRAESSRARDARGSVERIAYGADPDQFADWRGPADGGPPLATAILLHGGFYRSKYRLDLMDPLALDLSSRGWATWNVEYRRPDAHDWAATTDDVRAQFNALRRLSRFSPAAPVVGFGHSAGGQLALQLAETLAAEAAPAAPPPIALAVSLAGVNDLVLAHDRGLSAGAAAMALGGSPAQHPELYAAASPSLFARRLVPWLLVQGADDSPDFVEMSANLSGSEPLRHPELLALPGDHFSVIDPRSPIWRRTIARVTELVVAGPVTPTADFNP